MASRNFHKRRTKERKERQQDQRELARLRVQVRAYEGVSDKRASKMTAAECRRTIKFGKRRPFYPTPVTGHSLAMAAAYLAVKR